MPGWNDSDILVVTTTVASHEQATALADRLLTERLAACVQLEDIRSHYRWEGRMQADAEVRLTVKSDPAKREALERALRDHHPYELPQVVAWIAAASDAYARWVRDETSLS